MHILILALLSTVATALQYSDVGMLCLVNKERRKHGLKPLGLDPKLTKAAYAHSKDQARMRKMSHSGSDGSKPSSRVERAGFNWRQVGENVAYGYRSMEEVMRTWMNSPGHRANILGKQFTMFGSGFCTTGGTTYYTQDFGDDGKGSRNVPKCDGSDTDYPANGQMNNNDSGNNYPSGNQSGNDYGSSNGGGNDYGSSNGGGKDYGSDDSGNDYGSSNGGGNDYGSGQGGRGGRRGGRGGQQGSGSGRGGNDYGSNQGGRGGRRGGRRGGSYGSAAGGRGGRRGGRGGSYGSGSGRGGRGGRGGSYGSGR